MTTESLTSELMISIQPSPHDINSTLGMIYSIVNVIKFQTLLFFFRKKWWLSGLELTKGLSE